MANFFDQFDVQQDPLLANQQAVADRQRQTGSNPYNDAGVKSFQGSPQGENFFDQFDAPTQQGNFFDQFTETQPLPPPTATKEPTPAEQFQQEAPLLRTAGRGVRNVVGGLAGAVDVPLLLAKTPILGAGLLTGNESLKNIGMTPSMHETALNLIDKATGDRLKPIGGIEKTADFASELATPAGLVGKAQSAAPTVAEALLAPSEAVLKVAKSKLPAPEVTEKAAPVGFREVKKAAGQAYEKASKLGGVVSAQGSDNFIQRMFKSAQPENERVGRVFKEGPIADLLKNISDEYSGKPMSLADIEALDQRLGKEANRYFSKIDGAKPEYGDIKGVQAALREVVQESLDNPNIVEGSSEGFEAYKRGVELYAKSKRLEEIDDVVNKALGQQQPARALRRGFDRLRNYKGFNKYSQEEQDIINTIADETLSSEGVKFLTSRLTGILALGSGQPLLGGALAAGSAGARGLEKAGQLGKVNKLQRKILEGTGLQNLSPKDLSVLQRRGLVAASATAPRVEEQLSR